MSAADTSGPGTVEPGTIEPGVLCGVGTGPGDPELMTFRAARRIAEAPVVAYFCKRGTTGQARRIADAHIGPGQIEEALEYPVTNEIAHQEESYRSRIEAFFDQCAERLAAHLEAGRSVCVLNEGDPYFYGSFMHVHLRLRERFRSEVVPGVISPIAAAAQLPAPLVMRDDTLSVVPGTLPEAELEAALAPAQAAVIMKLGKQLPKIRRVLERLGLTARAWYIERASFDEERVRPLAEAPEETPGEAPYFSLIVIHGEGVRR